MTFKVGDVVWLKSGSPAMCVEVVAPNSTYSVAVVWAPADGGAHLRDKLNPDLLTATRTPYVDASAPAVIART